jgi:tuberous sclerosis protein 2
VIRYSCLPASCVHGLIVTLCHTLIRETLCPTSWKLAGHLLGTHLGRRGIYTLCCILEEEESVKDPLLLQGAVSFLSLSLWGPQQFPHLTHSYASVLPSMLKALKCGHLSVAFEVVHSVERLVKKYGRTLDLVTWDLITNILETAGTYVENEMRLEDGSLVAQHFHHVCCCIEDLCSEKKFSGSWERFFNLVEKFTLQRPVLGQWISSLCLKLSVFLHRNCVLWLWCRSGLSRL